MSKHAFYVDFVDEAEVFWPTAEANGLIPEFFHASQIVITNASLMTVSIWFGKDVLSAWEWIPLSSSDGTDPGGSIVLDLKANNASTWIIRAVCHGGWTGKLSFLVL